MFRHKHKHPAFKALRDTVAFVVLCVALQGYVARTDGAEAAAAFRTVWPTLAFFCSCGGALLVHWAGAALPLWVSAIFSAVGMALQVSLHPANATELKLFCLLAFVGCICTVIVFALLRVLPQTLIYNLCVIGSAVSFLFLRVFCKPLNSTYAWVSVAGHSFQLTEALKLILVIGFSAAVTNDAWNEGVRFRAALLLLAVYAGGFFVLNELGTLLVCLLDCGVMALLYCSIKHTLSLVAFGALTGGIGYAFLKLCNGMQNPAGPFRLGQLVYRKLAVRLHYFGISDFSTLSSKEVSSSAYQAYTTWRSLLLARPVGAAAYRVSTPVGDSDLILCTLANRGGWICLFLTLFGAFLLIVASLLLSTRCGGWLSCVGTGAGCAVGLAGLVNLFSTASLLLIGVQFPFLGAGGSSFICSWAAITLLLCSTIPTRQGSRELLAASQITKEDVS